MLVAILVLLSLHLVFTMAVYGAINNFVQGFKKLTEALPKDQTIVRQNPRMN